MDHRAPEERARQVRRASLQLAGLLAACTCAWFFLFLIAVPSLVPSVATSPAWVFATWGLYVPVAAGLLAFMASRLLQESRRAEERLRTLLEGGGELTLFLSSEGVVRYCGPAAEAILGRPWPEIEGHPILDFLHPQDVETLQSTLRQLSMPGAPETWRLESRWRHADGAWRTLDGVGRLAVAPDGSTHITILYRDVTEQARRELALEESSRRHDDMLARLPVGVACITLRPPVSLLSANAPFIQMLGYAGVDELVRLPLSDLFLRAGDCVAFCERLALDGQIQGLEIQLRRRAGTPLWISIEAHPVTHAAPNDGPCFDCTFQEISSRRLAELGQRVATQALRTILYASPTAIVIVDPEGRVSQWNAAAERLFGWSEGEIQGRPLTALLAERENGMTALLANLPGEEARAAPATPCQTRAGQPIFVDISTVPLRDELGQVSGAALFAESRPPMPATGAQADIRSDGAPAAGAPNGGL